MKAKSDLTKKVHAFYNDKNERVWMQITGSHIMFTATQCN